MCLCVRVMIHPGLACILKLIQMTVHPAFKPLLHIRCGADIMKRTVEKLESFECQSQCFLILMDAV